MAKVIDLRGRTMDGGDRRPVNRIKNIAVHYSATASGDVFAFERHWKGSRGWKHGGYHEVVLTNGDVQLCYNPEVISNGVKGHNTASYNICYVGTGKPNDKQLQALIERVNYNRNRFNVPISNVKGHREFSGQATSCPGLNMGDFRKRLGGAKVHTPKQQVKSKPKQSTGQVATIQSTLNSRYGFNIAVDNIAGPETRKALVKAYQTELNRQYKKGLVVDGLPGPKTDAAGITIRKGAKGNLTWITQAMLYIAGYDPQGIDGHFGDKTEKAVRDFQRANQLVVDGVPGKKTFAKLIRK